MRQLQEKRFRTARFWLLAVLAAALAILVLIFVWAVFVPVLLPVPPFRSALVEALDRSNAKIRETSKDNITADSADIAPFFPDRPPLSAAEATLQKEGFSCGPVQRWSDTETARWGQKYRRFKTCTRRTYFHPFASFGWRIDLFLSEGDVVESMSAARQYDGL